jgi:hypothetical protein
MQTFKETIDVLRDFLALMFRSSNECNWQIISRSRRNTETVQRNCFKQPHKTVTGAPELVSWRGENQGKVLAKARRLACS